MKKLTCKEQRFVHEYLIDPNASQAGLRAGYKNLMSGRRLATKSYILEAIAEAQEEQIRRIGIRADWVLKNLKEVVERCMQHIPVLDREGNETGMFTFNAHGANKALEQLGKYLKLWTDKVESKTSLTLSFEGEVSDEERSMLKEVAKAMAHKEIERIGNEG